MLNLNLNESVRPELAKLITEFRRAQVSRFPINVDANSDGGAIRFVDSRMPKDSWNPKSILARLEVSDTDKNGNPVYKLSSRLIENEKYSPTNNDYHTKSTNDLKKLLKLLKEYVKPYSAQEIANRTWYIADSRYDEWQTLPTKFYHSASSGIGREDLAKEILALMQRGVEFHTEKFRRVALEGMPHYIESVRRQNMPSCKTHVYVQPDDSVVVTTLPNTAGIDAGCLNYENLQASPVPIQQAVAMLLMVEDDTFIPEAGYRVNDKQFWVEVNPHELKS
jgi:hypothetical protein